MEVLSSKNLMNQDFIPVILGTDWNAYGVASSFNKEYAYSSIAVGMSRQALTENLEFLEVITEAKFSEDDTFVGTLLELVAELDGAKLLLISCSDYYSSLIIDNAEVLSEYFLFNYVNSELRDRLENKNEFYKTCEEFGLTYPKTILVDKDNYKEVDFDIDFPVIAKPSNSSKWISLNFEGYKKAYKINSLAELKETLELVYTSDYDDVFIIQDFIPGDEDAMFVCNAYVSSSGEVWMTHAAQTALEEVLPRDIGNYTALISGDYSKLTDMVKSFLKAIGYRGFANFDFKYDSRSGEYKVFEINLRQGASSLYMTTAGNNFVTYLVDDLIYNKEHPYYNHTEEHLWYYVAKSVLKKYCAPLLKDKVSRLLNEGKSYYHLEYAATSNLKRFILSIRRKLSTMKYYPKYK